MYQAFLVITLSMAVAGISPLLMPRYRRVFRGNWPRIRPALRFLFAIEIANLIAVGTSQYAVSFGTPSLVSAVEASIPAYTFLLSLVLYAVTRKYGEEEARHRLLAKQSLRWCSECGYYLRDTLPRKPLLLLVGFWLGGLSNHQFDRPFETR